LVKQAQFSGGFRGLMTALRSTTRQICTMTATAIRTILVTLQSGRQLTSSPTAPMNSIRNIQMQNASCERKLPHNLKEQVSEILRIITHCKVKF
jgi:hypothetical protein